MSKQELSRVFSRQRKYPVRIVEKETMTPREPKVVSRCFIMGYLLSQIKEFAFNILSFLYLYIIIGSTPIFPSRWKELCSRAYDWFVHSCIPSI